MAETERFMPCPAKECPAEYEQWVSPEDEDASFSELWNHVFMNHSDYNQDKTADLMRRVVVIERDEA